MGNGRRLCNPSHTVSERIEYFNVSDEWEGSVIFTIMVAASLALEAILKNQVEQFNKIGVASTAMHGYRRRSREEPESARLCVKICNYGSLPFCFRYMSVVYWPFGLQSLRTPLWFAIRYLSASFKLISIARYVLKSQEWAFEGPSLKYSVSKKSWQWKPQANGHFTGLSLFFFFFRALVFSLSPNWLSAWKRATVRNLNAKRVGDSFSLFCNSSFEITDLISLVVVRKKHQYFQPLGII